MADNGNSSANTAVVAIVVIVLIAIVAYFAFFRGNSANPAQNIEVNTPDINIPTPGGDGGAGGVTE
jgi:hypothetical protein